MAMFQIGAMQMGQTIALIGKIHAPHTKTSPTQNDPLS